MPIKEIMAFSAIALASIVATHPLHPILAVRAVEMRILKEATRTDNWGNPSIFKTNRSWTQRKREDNRLKTSHCESCSLDRR